LHISCFSGKALPKSDAIILTLFKTALPQNMAERFFGNRIFAIFVAPVLKKVMRKIIFVLK